MTMNTDRTSRPAERAPRSGKYPGQGAERLLILGGIGCLALVALLVGVVVVGISALIEIANKPPEIIPEIVDTTPPGELPKAPFELPVPRVPLARLGNNDLNDVDPDRLAVAAQQLMQRGDFRSAVQCQYISVIKSDYGRYDLACYYSLAGDVNAALYWLQIAAKEDGTNSEWATKDSDLENVRKDARWPRMLAYLRKCRQYWETTGHSETSLVLPRQATPDQPIPVFIGLHPMNIFAHGFVDATTYQALADEMGVAFLGVSGSIPCGKQSFVWTEDLEKDLARIDAALEEVKGRLTPAEGRLVLFGSGEGAWLAGELAARHPDRFRGAIVMSPMRRLNAELLGLEAHQEHRRQGLVALCGAAELPETVQMTKHFAEMFEKLGGRVSLTFYQERTTDRLPPGYVQKMPVWGRFILNPEAAPLE